MVIITRVIPGMMYLDKSQYLQSNMFGHDHLEKGDLVIASTARNIHDFLVGFVEDIKTDYVVIREIGSKRLCNYYNESFYKINKEKIGYEILEGLEYETYLKALKAFDKYTDYNIRFKSIRFENKKCFLQSRRMFSNDSIGEVSFNFNSKTTIKSIGEHLNSITK